jgi:hypothetical protein
VRNIARRQPARRDSDRGDFVEIATALETLRQASQECAARTELRRKDAKPLAGADLVDLVEQVDYVETQFHSLQEAGGDRLDDAEIDLLIAWQASTVRNGAVHPKAATGKRSTANRVL